MESHRTIDKLLRSASRAATRAIKRIEDDPREVVMMADIEKLAFCGRDDRPYTGDHLEYRPDGSVILAVPVYQYVPVKGLPGAFVERSLDNGMPVPEPKRRKQEP